MEKGTKPLEGGGSGGEDSMAALPGEVEETKEGDGAAVDATGATEKRTPTTVVGRPHA